MAKAARAKAHDRLRSPVLRFQAQTGCTVAGRARAAPVRSYTVRIAEAADVFALKVLADELAAVARGGLRADAAGRSIARAARLAAQRRGGMIILATPAWRGDKVMGFNKWPASDGADSQKWTGCRVHGACRRGG